MAISAVGALEGSAVAVVEPGRLSAWGQFRRNRLAVAGLAIVALLLVAALGASWLAPFDPAKQSLIEKRARPGNKFLLGADEFGRDILSRVLFGSRVALLVGLLSVAIALGLGLVLGCLAGFAGGWIDALIMPPSILAKLPHDVLIFHGRRDLGIRSGESVEQVFEGLLRAGRGLHRCRPPSGAAWATACRRRPRETPATVATLPCPAWAPPAATQA